MTRIAVGVDVAARRGCDVVVVTDTLVAAPVARVQTADELRDVLAEIRPGVVAIDAPPSWAPPGTSRQCERDLMARGISIFITPSEARGRASTFYDWMRTGFEMFAGATAYPTLETFPHATAVALRGRRPERGLLRHPRAKKEWRLDALRAAHVDVDALRTQDEVDAALCAITGLHFLAGTTIAIGDPEDGVITVPEGLPPTPKKLPSPSM